MEGSIMDSLGVEIIGVMSPVSICMLLVVLIVSFLSPPPSAAVAPPVTAATLVYLESPSDSPAQKLEGALLNAAVFVALVAAVTFLLVVLYYYNFTGFLKNYMRFSAFFVLASMGGPILLSLLRRLALPVDAPTCLLLLFNFAAVGVLAVFSPAVPILLRQAYTVSLGVIVAAWLTKLPEWTTWSLLIALALYDAVAVLSPRGPLRILVDLASSRDDDLPALVYEARPTVAPSSSSSSSCRPSPPASATASFGSVELQPIDPPPADHRPVLSAPDSNSDHAVIEIENLDEERSPLMPSTGSSTGGDEPQQRPQSAARTGMRTRSSSPSPSSPSSDIEMFETTRGIRLGLGDFVFYSVLVGRAAMYDLMTVYACYLAIISGLGCTLILLSVCRQALPALPISITLGVAFYFLTRLLMEPFVVGSSASLVMF
ncbi:presenilin-like protein At1g08700 [Elaeis guineensis]|uniref:Presenilin n=1 Tax=Elaeis guineensis var. tenera TaxID=51953 RepID=A0A6I9QI75_ELAGV|nr:presenilin-like protein At1g08700 [Elaeis guineensis]